MKAASCLLPTVYDANLVEQAAEACRDHIGGAPDHVIAFISSDWKAHLKDFIEILTVYGRATLITGCSGDGLVGVSQEGENVSGTSLLFLRFPGSEIERTEITNRMMERAGAGEKWTNLVKTGEGESRGWITLGDPLKIDLDSWVRPWNCAFPDVPTFGGLASGGPEESDLFLFTEKGLSDAALLALHFSGDIRLGGVVSQGCRPIGEPFTITKVARNQVLTIGQRKAFDVLEEAFHSLKSDEQDRAKGNVFAGIAMDEYVDDFDQGNFQIRPITGGNLNKGALSLGAYPRVGQTMQFQMRDKDAADRELRERCEEAISQFGKPAGAIMFKGAGRGVRLFEEPNHDIGIIEESFGKIPVAGIFSNGEVGPVGGRNFVHDHTASVVFFLDPKNAEKVSDEEISSEIKKDPEPTDEEE